MKFILQKSQWMEHSKLGGNAMGVLEMDTASVLFASSLSSESVFIKLDEKSQRAGHMQITARNLTFLSQP